MTSKNDLKKIKENIYEIPKSFRLDMKVPARIFISEKLLEETFRDRSLWQLINVATLPGIIKYALAMPDIHEGYGFPIGGVAAVDFREGVISPGGIGYDINCGVRLLASTFSAKEVEEKIKDLTFAICNTVPSGLGRGGKLRITGKEFDDLLKEGAEFLVKRDYGQKEDLLFCESQGKLDVADPSLVSNQAKKRGNDQVGTIGSGNHFIEFQKIEKIFDKDAAQVFGLFENQFVILIHTGSRGLGHQIATDYIRIMIRVMPNYNINLPDRELTCVPFQSQEGQDYFQAMSAGANFAWANRQMITHLIRQAYQQILGSDNFLKVVYDVAHNIAKIEEYNGKKVLVHRKGATRAFGPGRSELPFAYQKTGQPVFIPGSMGTASYVLRGTAESAEISFSSTCHGAGRRMSRHQAKRTWRGETLKQEMEKQKMTVCVGSMAGLAEEAPGAYKDIDEIVKIVDEVGIAKKVARLVPLGVIKG